MTHQALGLPCACSLHCICRLSPPGAPQCTRTVLGGASQAGPRPASPRPALALGSGCPWLESCVCHLPAGAVETSLNLSGPQSPENWGHYACRLKENTCVSVRVPRLWQVTEMAVLKMDQRVPINSPPFTSASCPLHQTLEPHLVLYLPQVSG